MAKQNKHNGAVIRFDRDISECLIDGIIRPACLDELYRRKEWFVLPSFYGDEELRDRLKIMIANDPSSFCYEYDISKFEGRREWPLTPIDTQIFDDQTEFEWTSFFLIDDFGFIFLKIQNDVLVTNDVNSKASMLLGKSMRRLVSEWEMGSFVNEGRIPEFLAEVRQSTG